MDAIYEPISLGFSCEVKYQLSRVLWARKYPGGLEEDFRRMLLTPDRGERSFERHVFDWQITPFAALLEYLERDFQGVFERDDLFVDDYRVGHRRLRTYHPHEFPAQNGVLDDALIDARYAQARAKFEHLAAKFSAHLMRPGPFLYVIREIQIYDDAVRLMALLRARNPDHRFKLLFIGTDGEDQHLGALEGDVFKAWTTLGAPDKPADRQWEGHDARWDELLAPWSLTLHGDDNITRTFDESLPPEPEIAAPGPAPARGWLSRLLPAKRLSKAG
jgi:hypothetical protein